MTSRISGVVIAAAMMVIAGPLTTVAAQPVDRTPLAVGTESGLFSEARNDGRQGDAGSWNLLSGRLRADAVALRFRIQPPAPGLPGEAGPMVLFGGLYLFGDAGGDMSVSIAVNGFASVTIPGCRALPCAFDVDIELPTHNLANAMRRLERQARLLWVTAELTLVRTFGAGTWLQVLSPQFGGDTLAAVAGTLGAVQPAEGKIFPFGAFPAGAATPLPADALGPFPDGLDYAKFVNDRRRAAGDNTAPLVSVPAALRVTINPRCDGTRYLTVHDDRGDWLYQRNVAGEARFDERLEIPEDVKWWIALHEGGIDFDQHGIGWGTRVGPVTASESVVIEAVFDCSIPRGSLDVRPAEVRSSATAPNIPVPSPAITTPSGAAPSVPPTTSILIAITASIAGLLVASAWRGRKRKQ